MTNQTQPPIQDRFVVNLVEDDENRVLFLRRSQDKKQGPGQWGLCSGKIEQGETPEQASAREIREELGESVDLEPVRPFGPVRDRQFGGIYEFFLFHYRWRGGTIRINYEHTDYAWITKEAFRDYDVMRGMDEDILYLDIWPRTFLREEFLP